MHPQARAAVARQERMPLPHSRLGVRLARVLTKPVMWARNRNPPPVGATVDLAIPGPAGDVDARLYRPDVAGRTPTVVFFHGGGFVFGSVETHDRVCRHLVRESECAVLSVDYRLAPEHPFPAAVEDAYAAVEWAGTNPDVLAGTGDLAVAGDSAGGNLAAVTALMAAEQGGPDLAYQALVYPSVGIDGDAASVRDHTGIVLSEADLEFFGDCYYRSDVHRRNPYADPSNAADLSAVAPATVVTAGFDPLRDGGRAYAERLVRDGVATRYVNYDDMPHGFLTMPGVDRARGAIAALGDDLADALGAR